MQLRKNIQTNDLQSNDKCAHLGTGKLSDQNKHILVIRKAFSMKQKVFFTETLLRTQWNKSHNTKISIYGQTRSYGCAPLNTIDPKLQ